MDGLLPRTSSSPLFPLVNYMATIHPSLRGNQPRIPMAPVGSICFEDLLPSMAVRLGLEGLVTETCKGFWLLMDLRSSLITFECLKRCSTAAALGLGDDEIRSMLREADLDGDGAMDQMEFCVLMLRLSPHTTRIFGFSDQIIGSGRQSSSRNLIIDVRVFRRTPKLDWSLERPDHPSGRQSCWIYTRLNAKTLASLLDRSPPFSLLRGSASLLPLPPLAAPPPSIAASRSASAPSLHLLSLRLGLLLDLFVTCALLDVHAKCRGLDDARNVFDETPAPTSAPDQGFSRSPSVVASLDRWLASFEGRHSAATPPPLASLNRSPLRAVGLLPLPSLASFERRRSSPSPISLDV